MDDGEDGEGLTLAAPESGRAALLCTWSADGALDWCRQTGGAGKATVVDLSPLPGGGVFAAGRVLGEIVFSPGEPDGWPLIIPGTQPNPS